ncbi:MAG: hypothetical protein WBA88_26105 [Pseudaminobacter sp.]
MVPAKERLHRSRAFSENFVQILNNPRMGQMAGPEDRGFTFG